MSNNMIIDTRVHKYAYEGKKFKLKALLKQDRPKNIDALDPDGYSALYYACFHRHKACAKLLLKNGANPNERCKNAITPMHAVCQSGEAKILDLLLQYGGDLRLRDKDGRLPEDWTSFQDNSKLRCKIHSYIADARHKLLVTQAKIANDPQANSNIYVSSKQLVGFGNLYKTVNDLGVPIVVPIVNEAELDHDCAGATINNGAFMVYESMKWNKQILVTVKRLHERPIATESLDLLVDELKMFSRIHCSNVLQLMGVCQTANINNVILMFERVEVGSLFHLMHEKNMATTIKMKSIYDIMLSVCNAIIYLHGQNILHCYITSHSVLLTSSRNAKLANLEYAVEKSQSLSKQKRSRVIENHFTNCAYNWLAPEIINNDLPSEMSDMYSFCVVIWEMFNKTIPWCDKEWSEIKRLMNLRVRLPIDFETVKFPFNRIIKDGLSANPINRMSFEEVKTTLENPNNSVQSCSIFNDLTNDTITNLFEQDNPKKSKPDDDHTVASLDLNSEHNHKASKLQEQVLPTSSKKSHAPPPPPVPLLPLTTPLKQHSTKHRQMKSPVKLQRDSHRNANNNNNSKHNVSASLPCDESTKLKQPTSTDSVPTDKNFVSSLTFKKSTASDIAKNSPSTTQKTSSFKNLISIKQPKQNFEDNMQKATPDEKRNYFSQKAKSGHFYNSLRLTSPKKLDLSGISVEDNTIERGHLSRGERHTNNLSAIYSTVNMKPTSGPSGDHIKSNNSNEADKNEPLVRSTEEQKADLAKRLQKYSLLQKSDSYEKLVGEVRNFLCGSFDNLTRPLTQRSSSFDAPRTLRGVSNVQQQPQQSKEAGDERPNPQSRQNIGSSSFQSNTIQKTPRDHRFFAGLGSVKDLVKSYEELPNKEKNVSEFKVQQLRQERHKELLNVMSSKRFSPVDEARYRVNALLDHNNNVIDPRAQLPPIIPPKPKTPSVSSAASSVSTVKHVSSTKNQPRIEGGLNKKDLSTISERTERSTATTFIDTREGAAQHQFQSNDFNSMNSSQKQTPQAGQHNQPGTYISEKVFLTNSFGYDDHFSNQPIQKQPMVPKLDLHDLSSQSSDIFTTNTINIYDCSYDDSTSKIYQINLILNDQYTDVNNNVIAREKSKKKTKSSKLNNTSSQEDILSSLHLDDSSVACSEAVYLADFDSYANKHRSNSFENLLNQTDSTFTANDLFFQTSETAKHQQQQIIHTDKYIIDAQGHKDYKCEMITQNEANNRYYIKSSIKDNTTGESLLHSEAHVEASKVVTQMIINKTSD